jgi:hypothetical protein
LGNYVDGFNEALKQLQAKNTELLDALREEYLKL